jgi:hypothetical protein
MKNLDRRVNRRAPPATWSIKPIPPRLGPWDFSPGDVWLAAVGLTCLLVGLALKIAGRL